MSIKQNYENEWLGLAWDRIRLSEVAVNVTTDKLNEKASKVKSIIKHECNVVNICFIDNKHVSQILL